MKRGRLALAKLAKMMPLINKLADWPPKYHKTARTFPRIFSPRHSMIKLSLTVDTHAEEIGEVFEHSDPYFVQILEESVKHRHEVARSVLLPDNHGELVDREGQRTTHLPLQTQTHE